MSGPLAHVERLLAAGHREEASAALASWLRQSARSVPELARAASIALALGDPALAHEVGERFVAGAPGFAGSHHALALALLQSGEARSAARSLRRALELAPGAPLLRLHLGQALLDAGETQAAAVELDGCIAGGADWPATRKQRGIARLRLYDGGGAHEDFTWLTAREPDNPDAWRGLAEAAELVGYDEQAIAARAREADLDPDSLERARERGLALSRLGSNRDAREVLARVLEREPGDLRARWAHWNLLPVTYEDEPDVARWRANWLIGLGDMEAVDPALHTREELADALVSTPNFLVHYQGGDLTGLQRRYGALVSRWARHAFPALRERAQPRASGRLRVGFASAHLRRHTVWNLFGRWLMNLDRTRFEVVAIHLGAIEDEVTRELTVHADEVLRGLRTNAAWVQALDAADLDAIVWLDIGMDGLTQLLAPLRFAPVTAMAWGHPVTSGLDSVDHFLSSALMEPPGAHAHYRECLETMPGLGIDYELPQGADAFVRAARAAGHVPRLLCAQSVFKFVPRNYELLARISLALPEARFDLVPHPVAAVRAELHGRLRAAFAAHGIALDERVTLHASMPRAGFLALMRDADVLLDTFGWSGGHTTLEGLAHDLPVVTAPGEFMRSRHSFAMLRVLGLEGELAARDLEHYVEIVVRLVRDPAFHARMVAAIRAGRARLFGNLAATRALEELLWRACGRAERPELPTNPD